MRGRREKGQRLAAAAFQQRLYASGSIPAQQPGDLFVVLNVALPKANTEAAKAAYADFAKAFEFNPRTGIGM